MLEFFTQQMDYVYFVSGVSFFLLAALCFTLPDKNLQRFPWSWFGLFSFFYGLYTWGKIASFHGESNQFIDEINKTLVVLSLLSLTEFARRVTNLLRNKTVPAWIYGIFLLGIVTLTTLGVPSFLSAGRMVLCAVGGLWVLSAVYLYAKIQKDFKSIHFLMASLYTILVLLIQFDTPKDELFPLCIINSQNFLLSVHIPVDFFITLVNVMLTLLIWYVWEGLLIHSKVTFQEKNLQRFIGFVVVILAVLLWLGNFIANRLGEEEEKFRRDWILAVAQQNALKIDFNHILRLKGSKDDLQNVSYQELKLQLQSIKDVLKNVRFLYLMRKVNDHIVFLADSEPQGSKDESPPGQIYGEASQAIHAVFNFNQSLVEGPFADRWGNWVSGFAPVYDPLTGQVIAVLGVDQGASDFEQSKRKLRLGTIGFIAIPIIFILILLMLRQKLMETINTSADFDPRGQLLRWSTLIGISVTGFVLTSFLFFLSQHTATNAYQKIFHQRAVARSVGVAQVLNLQVERLIGIQSFINSQQSNISKNEFAGYLLSINNRYPKQWYALMYHHLDDLSEYKTDQPLYVLPQPINDQFNSGDLLKLEQVKSAVNKADQSSRIILSQPFYMKSLSPKLLVLLVAPVFDRKNEGITAGSAVSHALKGYVINIFESENLLRSAYSRFPAEGLTCEIEDPLSPPDTRLLYRHKVRLGVVDWNNRLDEYVTTLDIADRQWRMTILPSSAFKATNFNNRNYWMIPFGFILTTLICFFVNLLMLRRHEAELLIQSLRSAKDRGEEASRLKNEFIFNISHEMRTPLNGIIGFAELVEGSKELSHAQGMARMIISESEVLLALVNEVLDQAKLEAKKITLEPSPTELMEIINYVRRKADLQASKKGLKIEVIVDPDVPRFVFVDRMRLSQILINLLNNAVKFTFKGGITLQVKNKGSAAGITQLYFAVTDTGIGIPQDKQHLIFQHFTQIDGTLTRHFGGAGLGLSIVKGFVDLMGGKIGFDSQSGQGTTFWFTIPVLLSTGQSGEVNMLEKALLSHMSSKDATILVVEDYPPNLDIVRFHLEEAGYKVKVAGNGAIALEICSHEEVHLILMDIQMPVLDGYKATQQLRAMEGWRKKVPILGFTANADNKTLHECLTMGMNGIIVKPVRKSALLTEVAQWLKPPEQMSEKLEDEGLTVVADQNIKMVVFDHPTAIEEFGGNSSLLDIMVRSFLLQVHQQVLVIDEAILRMDGALIGREAHKIRGAAANLTAALLSQKAKELELKGKANDLENIDKVFQEFRGELDKFEKFVNNKYKTPDK